MRIVQTITRVACTLKTLASVISTLRTKLIHSLVGVLKRTKLIHSLVGVLKRTKLIHSLVGILKRTKLIHSLVGVMKRLFSMQVQN